MCRFVHGLARGHPRFAPPDGATARIPGPPLWGRGAARRSRSRACSLPASPKEERKVDQAACPDRPAVASMRTLLAPLFRSPHGRSPAAPQRARETARHRRAAPPLPRRAPVRPGRDHADLQPDRPHHCRRRDAGRAASSRSGRTSPRSSRSGAFSSAASSARSTSAAPAWSLSTARASSSARARRSTSAHGREGRALPQRGPGNPPSSTSTARRRTAAARPGRSRCRTPRPRPSATRRRPTGARSTSSSCRASSSPASSRWA